MRLLRPYCLILLSSLLLTACGGGSDKKESPPKEVTDTTAPVITLNGDEVINIVQNELYAEIGAVAIDDADGEVEVIIDGMVNPTKLGQYDVLYSAVDKSGNESSISRTVNVLDPDVMKYYRGYLFLGGNAEMYVAKGSKFVEPGAFHYTDFDQPPELLSVYGTVYGTVNVNEVGEYQIFYQYKKFTSDINAYITYSIARTVKVVDSLLPDESPLVIEIRPKCSYLCVYAEIVELPVSSEGDYVIEWAEGQITKNRDSFNYQSLGSLRGKREIKIYGADAVKYACAVKNWGSRPLTSLDYMFAQSDTHSCEFTLPDTPLDTSRITSAEDAFKWATINDSKINQLDLSQITNMTGMFRGATIEISLSDFDVSNATNMKEMFRGATFSQDATLSGWDVSNVTNMSGMFMHSRGSSGISNWDVSQVTDMSHMFENTCSIDDITTWDVSNVKNMNYMFADILDHYRGGFYACFEEYELFNQAIGIWDVSNVETMQGMFSSSKGFNQPLENWDVSKVTDMSEMFGQACFNQPLNDWDVSNVQTMKGMFSNSYGGDNVHACSIAFNQPLDKWNVANVTDMSEMFNANWMFNHPLDMWDVSNVTNMKSMFAGARRFNQPLNNWDVKNVLSMRNMFSHAVVFDQDISNWVLQSLGREDLTYNVFNSSTDEWETYVIKKERLLDDFLSDAYAFSSENYDKLLTQWPNNDLAEGLTLDVRSEYTQAGATGRDILINQFGWTINDKGLKQETLH